MLTGLVPSEAVWETVPRHLALPVSLRAQSLCVSHCVLSVACVLSDKDTSQRM